MKRNWKISTAAVTAALLLTGCASTETQETASASVQAAETETAASSPADETAVDTTSSASLAVDSSAAQAAEQAAQSAESDHKTLVVYYSASDVGNTQTAADYIASEVNADLFRLVPVDGYDDEEINFNNDDSRISREHDDDALQEQVELVSTSVENWDSYDTVFIGYPIWWGQASWVLNQFVENNDFTGKTVIPFATSQMSGIGSSGENLAEKAGTGNWVEGQRFDEEPDEAEVRAFADQYK